MSLYASEAACSDSKDVTPQNWASRILSSRWFSWLVHCCILANTVTVAWEQSNRLNDIHMPILGVFEHGFVTLYVGELFLRVYADRCRAFKDAWLVFDAILVGLAILAHWVLPVLGFASDNTEDNSVVGVALVLRTARLARVARAVRLVRELSHLWLLVHALLTSTRMIFYVLTVIAVVLYICNAVALELIPLRYMSHPDVPEHIQEIVEDAFPSLGMSMLTLVQFLCFDSIAAIYRPLAQYDWIVAVYFMLVIMVVGIVLMNVITAVIVNTALHQSNEDKELAMAEERRRKGRLMEALYSTFQRLDKDGSGQLTLRELIHIKGKDRDLLDELSGNMDPTEIFKMLDVDRSNTLGIYEFCEGLYEVVVGQPRVELRNLTRHVTHLADAVFLNRKALSKIHANMEKIATAVGCVPPLGSLGSGYSHSTGTVRTPATERTEAPRINGGADLHASSPTLGDTAEDPAAWQCQEAKDALLALTTAGVEALVSEATAVARQWRPPNLDETLGEAVPGDFLLKPAETLQSSAATRASAGAGCEAEEGFGPLLEAPGLALNSQVAGDSFEVESQEERGNTCTSPRTFQRPFPATRACRPSKAVLGASQDSLRGGRRA